MIRPNNPLARRAADVRAVHRRAGRSSALQLVAARRRRTRQRFRRATAIERRRRATAAAVDAPDRPDERVRAILSCTRPKCRRRRTLPLNHHAGRRRAVEVEQRLDLEAGALERRAQRLARVAPLVAEHLVERAVQRRVLRHEDDRAAAGRERAADVRERGASASTCSSTFRQTTVSYCPRAPRSRARRPGRPCARRGTALGWNVAPQVVEVVRVDVGRGVAVARHRLRVRLPMPAPISSTRAPRCGRIASRHPAVEVRAPWTC